MQHFQILLIEDDRSAALDAEMLLDEMGLRLLAVKNTAEAAHEFILQEQPDLIILDIELKGKMTGLDLAREIFHLQIPIIFTTSYNDKASFEEAKSLNSFGYLVKPFNKLSLQSAIEQAMKAIFPESSLEAPSSAGSKTAGPLGNSILVRHNNVLQQVRLEDILYIQGEGNYCAVFTHGKKYMLKMSLKKILDQLPVAEFAPVHKSFIVRLDKVESVDVGGAKLQVGKEILPLGRNFKNSLLDRFNVLK